MSTASSASRAPTASRPPRSTRWSPTSKDFPTTVVVGIGGKLYVMMSRLGELFADPSKAKSEQYTLMELKF